MTYIIWVSRCDVTTLIDELEYILSARFEAATRGRRDTAIHDQCGPQSVQQQLHEATETQEDDVIRSYYLIANQKFVSKGFTQHHNNILCLRPSHPGRKISRKTL